MGCNMKYICSVGTTWDYIAYSQYNDEFIMDELLKSNRYLYEDVVIFDGGEVITVPSKAATQADVIPAPWDSDEIETPWEG